MAEKVEDVIADLEKWRAHEGPSAPGWPSLRMAGLSQGAEVVLEKLRWRHAADGLHRAYRHQPGKFELTDLLTDSDIEAFGYEPTDSEPITLQGASALFRDVIREHKTDNDLYEDLWIGERMDE